MDENANPAVMWQICPCGMLPYFQWQQGVICPNIQAPDIDRPAAMTLTVGYAATSTGTYTTTGSPAPTVPLMGDGDTRTFRMPPYQVIVRASFRVYNQTTGLEPRRLYRH